MFIFQENDCDACLAFSSSTNEQATEHHSAQKHAAGGLGNGRSRKAKANRFTGRVVRPKKDRPTVQVSSKNGAY